jgi:hypothetical protein
MSGVLEATTSTALARTTVHAQFNRKALGVVLLNNLIPIVLKVDVPGQPAKRAILVFGPRAHKFIPYKDYGVRHKCCRRVLLFNVFHYIKCYLPTYTDSNDVEHEPYTYDCCRKCGAVLKDGCNHLIQVNARRSYNVDKFIYQAPSVLQEATNNELFKYQRGNC